MKHRDKMKGGQGVFRWLKRLDLARDELRETRLPRTAEEGVKQCAELSTASMALFKEEIRKSLLTKDPEAVEREARRLMARFSHMDSRWKTSRRKKRVTPQGS